MRSAVFKFCLPYLLEHEGGYVDHPDDPGGATNFGITQKTLSQWRNRPVTKADVKNLTEEEVGDIYYAKYWMSIRGDDLPQGLSYALFDFAVNSGVSRAAKTIQKIVGAKADGIIGGMTLNAIENSKLTVPEMIDAVCDARLSFLMRLRHWSTFKNGWKRRVEDVREVSKSLISRKGGVIHGNFNK